MDTFHAAVSTLHSFIKLIRSHRMKIFCEKDGIKTLQNLQEKILSWSRFEKAVEVWSIAGVFPFNFVKFARASLLQNRKLMTLLFNNTVFFSVLPYCHRSPAVFNIWLFCSLDWVCLSWLVVLTKKVQPQSQKSVIRNFSMTMTNMQCFSHYQYFHCLYQQRLLLLLSRA